MVSANQALSREAAVRASVPAPMPIIVGFPRSGTTLLRLMLDSHSELAVSHESGFIPMASNLSNPLSRMFYRRFRRFAKPGGWTDSLRAEFYQIAIGMKTWRDFHISDEAFREVVEQIEPFTISAGTRAFFQVYAARWNKPRWGDKTPFYSQYLRSVEQVLPEAHFIHLIRDGRDAAISGKGMPFVGDDIEAIGRRWNRQLLLTRKQSRACSHYLEVRYEDLVLNTTTTLKKICSFVSLPYEAQMEEYHQRAAEKLDELTDVSTKDQRASMTKEARLFRHRLTSQPPEPTRIGRWRKLMSRDDQIAFSRAAGPLLQELGYEK